MTRESDIRTEAAFGQSTSGVQKGQVPVNIKKKDSRKCLDTKCPFLSVVAIYVSFTTFIWIFVGSWFVQTFQVKIYVPVLAIYGFTTFMTVVNFLYASMMNPGYLPKVSDNRYFGTQPAYLRVNGVRTQLKLCRTCHFYRMPRTIHCSQCDYCIDNFDHHCPWVNNCIGRRNYRYFFAFLSTLTVHMITSVTICLIFLLYRKIEWNYSEIIITCVAILTALIGIPVMGLFCFHLFLIYNGMTTYEHVTNKYVDGGSPFNMGPCRNCVFQLCGPEFPMSDSELVYLQLEPTRLPEDQTEDVSGSQQVQKDLMAKFMERAASLRNQTQIGLEEHEHVPVESFNSSAASISVSIAESDFLRPAEPSIVSLEENNNLVTYNYDYQVDLKISKDVINSIPTLNSANGSDEQVHGEGDEVRWRETPETIVDINEKEHYIVDKLENFSFT